MGRCDPHNDCLTYRTEENVELKKKAVEKQTTAILTGQNELGEKRKKVRDLQAQLLQIQESKKAAVTGMCESGPWWDFSIISILTGRQFKEASRLAGESKSMSLQVEEQQEQLVEAERAMIASNQKLAELSDDFSRAREVLSHLERREGGYQKRV